MQLFSIRNSGNASTAELIVPTANHGFVAPPIVPQRFNSTSHPSQYSLVSPELNSVSAPKKVIEERARMGRSE